MNSGRTVNFYVDSSCLVRAITGDGPLLPGWSYWERAFASELVRVEVRRSLFRVHEQSHMSVEDVAEGWTKLAAIEATIEWLPVAPTVLAMAAQRTAMALKTLDALHLATARIVRDLFVPDLVFATHDRQLGTAAATFGFDVSGL